MDDLTAPYQDQGLQPWFIMIANPNGNVPSKFDCQTFAAQQGIKGRVLYDPTLGSQVYGNKETVVVTNAKAEITYKQTGINLNAIEQAVKKALLPSL